MIVSGAQINRVSQHIVQKHKFPVYQYDVPFKLGMAVEGDKYEVTSYTEIPYKIAQYSGKLSLSVLPSVSGFDIILGLPWLQTVNPLIPTGPQVTYILRDEELMERLTLIGVNQFLPDLFQYLKTVRLNLKQKYQVSHEWILMTRPRMDWNRKKPKYFAYGCSQLNT